MHIHQGVDIVELSKFKGVLSRNKDFIPDIFTEREKQHCLSMSDPYVHFAGRFAAKEAGLKALGIGMPSGIGRVLQEIEVVNAPSGKPLLSLNGWAGKISRKLKIYQSTVSISHSSDYAIATVIMVGT